MRARRDRQAIDHAVERVPAPMVRFEADRPTGDDVAAQARFLVEHGGQEGVAVADDPVSLPSRFDGGVQPTERNGDGRAAQHGDDRDERDCAVKRPVQPERRAHGGSANRC